MQKQTNTGIYLLELKLENSTFFDHNTLGRTKLSKGYYYYVGSAQKNLTKRIERHFKLNKKKHWHIDYLTTNKNYSVTKAYIIPDFPKKEECILVNKLNLEFNLELPIFKFGSSDCNNCESHLLYADIAIDYNQLCSLYHSTVLFMPSSKEIC